MLEEIATHDSPALERLAEATEVLARRSLAAPTLAYAQIAEPVEQEVEAERLVLRRGYRDALARILRDGVERGELEPHDTQTYGAAILGAISEALVGPLSDPKPRDHEAPGREPRPVHHREGQCCRMTSEPGAAARRLQPVRRLPRARRGAARELDGSIEHDLARSRSARARSALPAMRTARTRLGLLAACCTSPSVRPCRRETTKPCRGRPRSRPRFRAPARTGASRGAPGRPPRASRSSRRGASRTGRSSSRARRARHRARSRRCGRSSPAARATRSRGRRAAGLLAVELVRPPRARPGARSSRRCPIAPSLSIAPRGES